MMSQLAYVDPRSFREQAGKPYLVPEYLSLYDEGRWLRLSGVSELEATAKKSKEFAAKTNRFMVTPPFERSLAAWYLYASGHTFKEIGELFEISETRASSGVRRIRGQAYLMQNQSKFDKDVEKLRLKKFFLTVSKEVQQAHIVTQSYREMRDVECVMSCIFGNHAIRSAALRAGRQKFKLQRESVGDYRCICSDCKETALPELAIH